MSSNYNAVILNYGETGQTTLPTAKAEGYNITYEKVWSKNTGRSADATLLGDIVAIKRTIHYSIDRLTQAQINPITAVADSADPFHTVRFFDTKSNSMQSGTFYFANMAYTIEKVMDGTIRYKDIQIELIEQ